MVRVDPSNPKRVKYASAHDLRRSFGDRWAKRVMPAELKEMMRHESIETTLRYYVSSNAERTAETCWQRSPGADDAYAKAFASEIHNGSHNTTPARVAVNPEKTNTPGWTRTSGLAFRRRDPFGPRSATGSPTQVRPAGLEPATLGLEIPCSIHLSYGRVSFGPIFYHGAGGSAKGDAALFVSRSGWPLGAE